MNNTNRNYMLVIKRDNRDYLPLEWNLVKNYDNENLNTLEGIDNYTKKINEAALLLEFIDKNILSPNEKYKGFAIIFNEKGKTRELKDGPIFITESSCLDTKNIIGFLNANINNKEFYNVVYTLLKGDSKEINEFKYVIKNIEIFKEKGKNAVLAALSKYNNLNYEDRRHLALELYKRYIKR
ncbi:MAG: hypothetical protein ACI4WW_06255 [Candidatus Coprovivens sp.]